MTTIYGHVAALDERIRNNVVWLHVTLPDHLRMSVHIFLPAGQHSAVFGEDADGGYSINYNAEDLPPGVTMAGITRWPDIGRRIEPSSIGQQMIDLHDSALLGPLCVTHDAYEGETDGRVRETYVAFTYRCAATIHTPCPAMMPTEGKPLHPIGSRFHRRWVRTADAYAISMGWARRWQNKIVAV